MSKRKKSAPKSDEEMLVGAAGEDEPSQLLGAPKITDDLLDLLTVPEPEVAPPVAAPAPFAKLLAKAKPPEPVPQRPPEPAKAPEVKKRSFPDLPPDATKLPPPEELPVGAPRGLGDLPTLVAAVRAELPTGPIEEVNPAYLEAQAQARARNFSVWDASETGEAFPTPRQLVQGILWGLSTGLLGFGLSYLLFVKHETLANVPRIDRRAAETAPPLAYRSNENAPSVDFLGYAGGGLADDEKAKGPDMALKTPKVDTQEQTPTPTPTITPSDTPSPTASVNVDNPENYPGNDKQHVGLHKMTPVTNTALSPTPSAPAPRPGSKGWVAAWAEAQEAIIRFSPGDGHPPSLGVCVSKEGLVLACASRLPSDLSRVQTMRDVLPGTLVGSYPALDIALVQLPPGNYGFIPLCPEPPRSGEWLLTPSGLDPFRQLQQQCSGGLSGGAFRLRGLVTANSVGGPLINDRAEVVGLALGHPPLYTGNQQVAASADSLLSFVESHGKSGGGGSLRSAADIFLEYMGIVSGVSNRVHPTGSNAKVVAGEAMGNFPLGLSRSDLLTECGQPAHSEDGEGISRLEFSTQQIVCYVAKDKVVAIETEFAFFSAGRGLSVGVACDSSRFLAEFPGSVWVDQGQTAYAIAPGLELECQAGKITKIRVVPK